MSEAYLTRWTQSAGKMPYTVSNIWGQGSGGGISMKNSGEALHIVSYKTVGIQTLHT